MKRFSHFWILSFLLARSAFPQGAPEATLKIAEKSGFLGMGGPKFLTISLSTKNQDKTLNSDNVNGGDLYYFLIKNSGPWKMDADFLKDDLPKLSLTQGSLKLPAVGTGDIIVDGENTLLLIGFNKTFLLHEPFAFSFPIGEQISTVAMNVPLELWPGYSKFMKYYEEADKALADSQELSAIGSFNTILLDQQLSIFPSYTVAKSKRTLAFLRFFNRQYEDFERMIPGSGELKERITKTADYGKSFRFVSDSVALPQAGILSTDSLVGLLVENGKAAQRRTAFVFDSLQQTLDDLTIRWIIVGSSDGKTDYKYKYMIETLAYAFTSVNFSDSAAKEIATVIPEEMENRLKKYSLTESYETFVRVSNDRWKRRLPLFPGTFLTNVKNDSAQFPLPYYSMVKAVSDYYLGDFTETKKEILNVMRRSYDHELTGRLDQLRILIETKEKRVPTDVLRHLGEGRLAEEKGESDKAIEHYKDAMVIQEDYAPAAFALGKLYDRMGDSYKANNFFQKAITSDTLYYSAYRFLYLNYIKNANFKPMIDLLNQALNRGNDFYDIHYHLGVAYNGAGLYEEAIGQYERALELNAKSIDANIQAGIAHQNMKSYNKAREYFNRAIQIDPENQVATESLKRLDELQKKF